MNCIYEEVVYEGDFEKLFWGTNYCGSLGEGLLEGLAQKTLRLVLTKAGEDDILPARDPKSFMNDG